MVDTYLPFWLFFFLLILSTQSIFFSSSSCAVEEGNINNLEEQQEGGGWGTLIASFFYWWALILFVSIPILFLGLALLVKVSLEEREKLLFADHLPWTPQDDDTFTPGEDMQYWKLHVEEGRQRWFYHPPSSAEEPVKQNIWEKYFLGLDIVRISYRFPSSLTLTLLLYLTLKL